MFPLLETENGEVIKPSDGDEVDYETFNSDYETFKSELETQTTKNARKNKNMDQCSTITSKSESSSMIGIFKVS